jgi:phenylacetate-CoA ligase
LLDSRVFDCFLDPAVNARALARFQPHILSGYPGALLKIALQHSRQGGEFRNLRKIFCGGEILTPHQRRILEECFGASVHDTYGATECNLAAWECPQTGRYHVCDDGIVLEICRDGVQVSPGQSGEVVITSLHSLTMPVIRLALGDTAVAGFGPCSCGSPFSTIQELQGRIIDFLALPDGREVHPFELLNEIVLAAGEWISQHQLIQEEAGRFRLLIVPRRPAASEELACLHTNFLKKAGTGVHLQVDLVEQIPNDAAGKFHFCRSLVTAKKDHVHS